VLAAAGDDDLVARVVQAVVALELGPDGILQLGDAVGGRILGEPLLEGLDGGGLDVGRGVEVRRRS